MATNTLSTFLRGQRERIQPENTERRRTPGLRREEVAARAGVSVTWYTWLEQGRGGVPSGDVLERIASALELDAVHREMLFLLAHDRPPPRRPSTPAAVSPAVQRVVDNLSVPAFVKTPTFQIVAWNRAATAVLGDWALVPEHERNLLRRVFSPGSERMVEHVDEVRRSCLSSFRLDLARAGWTTEAMTLIDELSAKSSEFRRLWDEGEIRSHATVQKQLVRPGIGELVLESALFHIDGSDGLSMIVWSPANEASARAIAELIQRAG